MRALGRAAFEAGRLELAVRWFEAAVDEPTTSLTSRSRSCSTTSSWPGPASAQPPRCRSQPAPAGARPAPSRRSPRPRSRPGHSGPTLPAIHTVSRRPKEPRPAPRSTRASRHPIPTGHSSPRSKSQRESEAWKRRNPSKPTSPTSTASSASIAAGSSSPATTLTRTVRPVANADD